MPTLNWIGKEKIINYHKKVILRLLEKQFTIGEKESDNMIIHGDNIEALKALLPKYEGKIDFIYIDPPYNTGNEGEDNKGWIYNDNVNDSIIKKWLGKVVGAEDLSRQDKWLCMMYPRLQLLYKLMSFDGVLFISIDDNMQQYLRLVCEEIFGSNLVEQYIWCLQDKSEGSFVKTAGLTVRKEHEYIIACFKSGGKRFKKYIGKKDYLESLPNPDNDPRGGWFSGNMSRNGIKTTTGSKYYTITNPKGISFSRNWTISEEEYKEALADNRIYFAKNGAGVPRLKVFSSQTAEMIQSSLFTDVHTSITGKNEIKRLFDGTCRIKFPKPPSLIYRLLEIASKDDSICLDCFAGSGTTAQAVLEYNKYKKKNVRFIEIELMNYAYDFTAERAKRVIEGHGKGKYSYKGIGGNFSYYELGDYVFDENDNLNPLLSIEEIKKYLFYIETNKEIEEDDGEDKKIFIGSSGGTAYYIFYDSSCPTVLNYDSLKEVRRKFDQYIIYADSCSLSNSFMEKYHIVFKKIPRDIQKI